MENHDSVGKLIEKIEQLSEKQSEISNEIIELKTEINKLKSQQLEENDNNTPIPETDKTVQGTPANKIYIAPPTERKTPKGASNKTKQNRQINLERFIGENLINKIGIAVLVIGVAIGSKYALDNIIFSPLVRIVSGYTVGLALLVVSILLKPKYTGYSAVLLGGAMAIFYFVSYAAFSFYSFIPQPVCFILLFLFTAFTVFASLLYNQQVIAHIGLIGAYVIPFLVSKTPGNIPFLLSYIALVNLGILAIALKKYWKPIYISTFAATYIIFLGWFFFDYSSPGDFNLAFGFLGLYFILFYATFLVYKFIRKANYGLWDVILIISNSFVFYGVGLALIEGVSKVNIYLGLFTLVNSFVHFIVAYIVFKQRKNDKALFYLTSGLVLVFLTLVFPVQFDGSWVTIFWTGEAVVLFSIGRLYKLKEYEYISYPLILLSFISQAHDWRIMLQKLAGEEQAGLYTPFVNIVFFTALFLSLAFAVITILQQKRIFINPEIEENRFARLYTWIIPLLLLLTAYIAFEIEINNYWNLKYQASKVNIPSSGTTAFSFYYNQDLPSLKRIWIVNYSIAFLVLASLIKQIRKKTFYQGLLGGSIFLLIIFLSISLFELSELRESYLAPRHPYHYKYSINLLLIRYYSLFFAASLLFSIKRIFVYLKLSTEIKDLIFSISILWILSSEWLHWLNIYNASNSYKLILSIFWGIYAFCLVILGIWKNKKHLRYSAIILLGTILTKVFFYDLTHLNTLRRAILFIALGIVMLGISFLYNKYKHLIFDEKKD